MEIDFPLEFLIHGTAVSLQARASSIQKWMDRVADAARQELPSGHRSTDADVTVAMYYFPAAPMQGDLDNIVKPILDAMSRLVYVDDKQVDTLLVRKFDPGRAFDFGESSPVLRRALDAEKPVVYIRVSESPFQGF